MKRALWIGTVVALVVAAAFILLSHTQSTTQVSTTQSASVVSFTPIATGNDSTVISRVNYLITDAATLAKIWAMTGASTSPPVVDFSKEDVLAVFAGAGARAITIASIEDSSVREVSVLLTEPAAGCSEATTAPYEIVETPTTPLPLAHEDSTTKNCGN